MRYNPTIPASSVPDPAGPRLAQVKRDKRANEDAMNRTEEIQSTLEQAVQVEAITPDAGAAWLERYRDHVSYLLTVIRSYGPSLQERLRDQSRQVAELAARIQELRRLVVGQRLAIVALALLTLALGAALHLQHRAEAREQRPPIDRVLTVLRPASPAGWYCTDWQPTGQPCHGGCWWERWCTPCIPECQWYRETECRPSSSGCPTLASAVTDP